MRAVIYTRSGPAEQLQLERCLRHVTACGYQLVAVAGDGPGESAGWADASQLISTGQADLVVVAPGTRLPIEVAGADEAGHRTARRPRRI